MYYKSYNQRFEIEEILSSIFLYYATHTNKIIIGRLVLHLSICQFVVGTRLSVIVVASPIGGALELP